LQSGNRAGKRGPIKMFLVVVGVLTSPVILALLGLSALAVWLGLAV